MPRLPLVLLVAIAIAALVNGIAAGGEEGAATTTPTPAPTSTATPTPTPDPAARLTIPQLAGAVVVMRFAGPPVPAYVPQALRAGRAAGVILFRDNLPSPAAARAATRRLQRARRDLPVIVSTDQEGGAIRNLPWLSPQQAPSADDDLRRRRERPGRRPGLRRAGVNVNLAPIADRRGPGTLMRTRAFGGDTATVARLVAASVRAYRGTGVAPTAKHFPGLGAATGNTDDVPVTIDRPARTIGAPTCRRSRRRSRPGCRS